MAAAMRLCSTSFLHSRRLCTAVLAPSPLLSDASPSPSLSDSSSSSSNPIFRFKSALRSESDPEKILDLFQSSTHLPGFYNYRSLSVISISKLRDFCRLDLVERLLEFQKSDPVAPKSEAFSIRIMSLYTKASMPDHALRTFEQIPAPSRTEKSICALLTVFLRQRRFDKLRDLFDRFSDQYGIVPDVVAHNIFLTALCETGEMEDARKVLAKMPEKGLEPDAISYNAVLKGCLKKGDEAGFEDTLKEMHSKAVTPNVVTYNLRMLNFCRGLKSFMAEELLEVLISKGIDPNNSTFYTIINGFCKEGDLESAMRVFKRMKSKKSGCKRKEGFSPTADIYAVLIGGFVDNGDFDLAKQISCECLNRKFCPPLESMRVLINELLKNSKNTEAKDLVSKMKELVKGDDVSSWTKFEAELPL